jgi:diguanylate cyclase (GGDEF)-like protein/PAS domain S-box-containing protein
MGKPTCEEPEKTTRESNHNAVIHKSLEDVYRSIVESTSDSIYIVDRDCRYLFINSPHLLRLGLPKEQIIGRPYGDFHSPEPSGEFSEKIEEVFTTGKSCQHEYISVRDKRHFLRTLSPLKERKSGGKVDSVVVVSKDITRQKLIDEAIRESEERYRTFFKTSRDCIFITSKDGQWIDFNDSAVKFFGYDSAQELQNVNIADLYKNRQDRKRLTGVIEREGVIQDYPVDLRKKDGTIINTLITSALIKNKNGRLIGYQGTIKDITESKQAEKALRASEEKYKSIIENIEDGYLEIDSDWKTLFFNQAWLDMIGYSRIEFEEMNIRHLMDEETAVQVSRLFEDVYETGKTSKGSELRIKRKDGIRIDVEITVSLIRDAKGKRAGLRNFIRDVTEQRKAEETIRRLAYHDSLTGLPNRLLVSDRLNMAIARAKRHRQYLAVLMLDLDKFKDVNDTLGHHMGDRLLQDVGERLTGFLRKGDTIARMGGDEFLILLPEIKKIDDSIMIARKVVDAFQSPFIIDGHEIHITTSVGIAIYPDSSEDADTLVKHADIAMYKVKDSGRNNYRIFVQDMASGIQD